LRLTDDQVYDLILPTIIDRLDLSSVPDRHDRTAVTMANRRASVGFMTAGDLPEVRRG
jgi:hypothetical protein